MGFEAAKKAIDVNKLDRGGLLNLLRHVNVELARTEAALTHDARLRVANDPVIRSDQYADRAEQDRMVVGQQRALRNDILHKLGMTEEEAMRLGDPREVK
jgi:hypothetical protein